MDALCAAPMLLKHHEQVARACHADIRIDVNLVDAAVRNVHQLSDVDAERILS